MHQLDIQNSAFPKRHYAGRAIRVSVFEFLDYRAYLKAFYTAKKRASKGKFSYRVFSNQTGVDSPNYLKLIVDGARNLTPAHAKRVARFCGLNENETQFFLALVKWNQNKQREEEAELWNRVLKHRMKSNLKRLSSSQLAILSDLRITALFELLQISQGDETVATLAKRLAVSPEVVEHGLAALQTAELVQISDSGISVMQKTLKSEDDVPSQVVRQYHSQSLNAAREALQTVKVEHREFISTTVSLPISATPEVKALLRETRDKLLALSENTKDANAVFQINFQFFPLTPIEQEPA